VRPETLTLALLAAAAAAAVALVVVLAGGRSRQAGDAAASDETVQQIAALRRRVEALEQGAAQITAVLPTTVRVGVIRYNPFSDMGGNMSFSVALLDARSNGVVISVLNDRQGSRVYGKPVEAGASPQKLSDEEQQAIGLAQGRAV
jgi:hypothetical protein